MDAAKNTGGKSVVSSGDKGKNMEGGWEELEIPWVCSKLLCKRDVQCWKLSICCCKYFLQHLHWLNSNCSIVWTSTYPNSSDFGAGQAHLVEYLTGVVLHLLHCTLITTSPALSQRACKLYCSPHTLQCICIFQQVLSFIGFLWGNWDAMICIINLSSFFLPVFFLSSFFFQTYKSIQPINTIEQIIMTCKMYTQNKHVY